MKKLKIIVAESSVILRKQISEAINSTQLGIVEHSVPNGNIALEWLNQCDIDVVIIDIEIVINEGLGIISHIKDRFPDIEIIILSNDNPESPKVTLECLKIGALDFIEKPSGSETELNISDFKIILQSLFTQIKLKKCSDATDEINSAQNPEQVSVQKSGTDSIKLFKTYTVNKINDLRGGIDLIMIASSTGGPVALDTICSQLSPDLRQPILVVQHMPPEFTNQLAQSLDKKYRINVKEGKDRDFLKKGQMIIAPGGYHMVVELTEKNETIIRLIDSPFVNGVKPAADVLFQSVADIYAGRNILAAILTGMGNDGTKGIADLKGNCNCYSITQSESSCVVYGMPKCVYESGLSDEVVELKNIAQRINQIALSGGGNR